MLAYTVYVDALEEEAERIADVAASGLRTAVRTCPGWDLEALVVHLGGLYRRWAAQILASDPLVRVDSTPPDPIAALKYFEASLLGVLDALRERGPDDPCWNFTGEDETVGFVARRLAHETTMHRVDAELTRGPAHGIDVELAGDGLDERVDVLLRHTVTPIAQHPLGGSICLICSDTPVAWVIDANRAAVKIRFGRGPANAAVVGSASDIFCFSWNRPTVRPLQVTGDKAVVEAWQAFSS
jgi:uncharacterized protein (TIGR03083 family)